MKSNAISQTPARRAFTVMLIPPLFRRKTHEEIEQAMRTGGFSSLRYEPAKRFATWAITGGMILVTAIIMSFSLTHDGYPPKKHERHLSQETTTAPHLSHRGEILPESDIVTE